MATAGKPPPTARVFGSGMTHPGVEHRQNQDAFFLWQDESRQHAIAGVLDGHGRELGQLAAVTAKAKFEELLPGLQRDDFEHFRADPTAEFQQLFDAAHTAIGEAFVHSLSDAGFETKWEDGFLLKKSPSALRWTSVSGGTTCTMVVILDAQQMYVANVGDSDCMLVSAPSDPHTTTPEQAAASPQSPLEVRCCRAP